MQYEQTSFGGGMNQLAVDTALAEDEYRLLINARQRFGEVVPVQQSELQTGLPAGNFQGGIGVGNVTLAFVSGLAYYQIDGTTNWQKIANFLMDTVADRLWAIAVPKSTQNYVRLRGASINQPIVLNTDFTVAGNPAGILVQDGINQAWLIQFNAVSQTFVARVTKTFAQWTNVSASANDREYVPVGRQMFFLNQKLYTVAPDRKSLYQSVTGRPLDFMLNVTSDGNKLGAESVGGAVSVSFAFDSNEITCVKTTNTPDSFIYATARHVRVIQLDYTNTIFGEPTYRQAAIVEAGVTNQESLVDVLGDATFVDNDGIKSFNAVETLMVEGRNSIFSLQIAALLTGHLQEETAAVSYDNYSLFYCRTVLGQAIAVYDTLLEKWVGLDITEVTGIKQFFVVATGQVSKLYAVCGDSLYLMYVLDDREVAQMHTKSLLAGNMRLEHKGQSLQPIFRGCTQDGTLRAIEFVDEQRSASESRTMTESVMAMIWPLQFPFIFSSKPNMINNNLVFNEGYVGKKISYIVTWDTDAALRGLHIITSDHEGDAASRQTN